jgi:hypothetical protein
MVSNLLKRSLMAGKIKSLGKSFAEATARKFFFKAKREHDTKREHDMFLLALECYNQFCLSKFIGIENHKSHKLYRKDQSLDSEGRELLKNIHKNDLGLVVHPKDRDSREGVFKACMKE